MHSPSISSPQGLEIFTINDDEPPAHAESKKRSYWSVEDEELLVRAYLTISSDGVVGNGQRVTNFWVRVTNYYDDNRGPRQVPRTRTQLKTHYHKVMLKVTKFAGIYNRLTAEKRSGTSDDQIIEQAREIYRSGNTNQTFRYEHVWRILKDEAKWKGVPLVQGPGNKMTRIKEAGDYSSSSNPATPGSQSEGDPEVERRPPGQKAGKRKRKDKYGQSSGAAEVYAALDERWNELRQIREEQKEEFRKVEMWQKDAAMKEDHAILLQDTTGMSEVALKLHLMLYERIREKYGL